MTSRARSFSQRIDIDGSLNSEGADNERSLLDDTDMPGFGETHLKFTETPLPTSQKGPPLLPSSTVSSQSLLREGHVTFEIISADVMKEGLKKYVAYTVLVVRAPALENGTARVTKRYSDFDKLNNTLKKHYPIQMSDISFPKKRAAGNFSSETIAVRSRAFEQYLSHVHSMETTKQSVEFRQFFYQDDLRRGYDLIRNGRYDDSIDPLSRALIFQERLFGPTDPDVVSTCCAIVVAYNLMDHYQGALDMAEDTLRRLVFNDSLYIVPLLELTMRLCWTLGKDKTDIENKLKELVDMGLETSGPSLHEIIVNKTLD